MSPGFRFTVAGRPAPQGSKDVIPLKTAGEFNGRFSLVEKSKYLKAWREAVEAAARVASFGQPALDGPLWASMVFTLARPAAHFRTGVHADRLRDDAPEWPEDVPDLSKLVRATEDALVTAGAIRDDARIVRFADVAKTYPGGPHRWALARPGAVIEVGCVVRPGQLALPVTGAADV